MSEWWPTVTSAQATQRKNNDSYNHTNTTNMIIRNAWVAAHTKQLAEKPNKHDHQGCLGGCARAPPMPLGVRKHPVVFPKCFCLIVTCSTHPVQTDGALLMCAKW